MLKVPAIWRMSAKSTVAIAGATCTRFKKPLLEHVAAEDPLVPPDAQAKIRRNTLVIIDTYAEQDHAPAATRSSSAFSCGIRRGPCRNQSGKCSTVRRRFNTRAEL